MNAIVIVALIGVFPPAPHTKAKNAEAARASQKRIMDEAAARHKAEMERWHGTKIGVRRSGVLLPDTIALHERVADIFTKADPPAPAGRAKQFARYLEKDAGFRCVGYGGTVESVTPNADGYLVEIFITPKLMSKFANVAFTSATSVEVWQLGKDGSLTNRTCKPHLTRLDIAMGD